ncbi:DNA-3-methyladenine glycosylase I [Pseudoprimorskyibacter insulae]|uniref:DNA-3-methyladenine glycosylase I n=1 Tax=Pseudoprimorskyibacter insulae TaxID=1695997 RepID=A0A2R8B105_9RHOB|nr:DNA-3-methyladenine glycosylase I [Pseudoprimorskyibacter insulae]SPF81950.1 hypothetical protein PRI8871_03777 [Pseudoprimorskyibacter insulae]
MRSFDEIYAIAAERKGGPEVLEARIGAAPLSADALQALPEDRWLAEFAKRIFSAGFNWKVIEAKWDGFEAAFHGFDLDRCAFMSDDAFDALLQDTRIVRNGAKIAAVRDNAVFLRDLRADGGAGKVLGQWPDDDYIGLLEFLKKHGARLGGATGQYALRFVGKDSFILSSDVTARLIAEGVIDKPAGSKSSMRAVQAAFNEWRAQSGRGLTEISRVLALSV